MAMRGDPVYYGHTVIQLRHVKTGKYVTNMTKVLADKQKTSTQLVLDTEGNTNSHIVIFPLYGARRETEVVGFEDLATFVFYKSLRREPRLYIHASIPLPANEVSMTRTSKNAELQMIREVNTCSKPSCWSIKIYEGYVPGPQNSVCSALTRRVCCRQ